MKKRKARLPARLVVRVDPVDDSGGSWDSPASVLLESPVRWWRVVVVNHIGRIMLRSSTYTGRAQAIRAARRIVESGLAPLLRVFNPRRGYVMVPDSGVESTRL